MKTPADRMICGRFSFPADGGGPNPVGKRLRRISADFVHNLLKKKGGACLPVGELCLHLFPCKVLRRPQPVWDQKGTPVKIRDYSRSCKLRNGPHTLWATVREDGKACGRSESEDLPCRDRYQPSGYRAIPEQDNYKGNIEEDRIEPVRIMRRGSEHPSA